jgi:hypothetical protein
MTSINVSDFFLLPDEVVLLTGYKVTSRQVEWLRTRGWRFELNGNRRPIIARRYAEKMLGCGTVEDHPKIAHPNFGALSAV